MGSLVSDFAGFFESETTPAEDSVQPLPPSGEELASGATTAAAAGAQPTGGSGSLPVLPRNSQPSQRRPRPLPAGLRMARVARATTASM